MPYRPLDLPRLLKDFEVRSHLAAQLVRSDLMPEFERRVRTLEREYLRHLNALIQEFQCRSRVLDKRAGMNKTPERSRQGKERWLRKMKRAENL